MMNENIKEIEYRIQAACDRAGRERSEVTLIAVSKTKPNEMLEEAYQLGMRHFGENKVQELSQKFEDLNKLFQERVYWHLIGHLQRNKVKYIIDKAVLIHSVDSLRLADQIEEEAAKKNRIIDILIEVNIAKEDTKFGTSEESIFSLLADIAKLPHIRVRGLMTIAPYVENPEINRKYFRKLRELFIDIKTKNIDNNCNGNIINTEYFDILSMGMTGDFEVAIEEGATMVRVGTGIFGERDYSKTV
ncbi:MAG: YggS family pyridoxal phosphate-dependent enzyme [Herbinix sp.]|nr:YggS family pyridoxal phosphate-dependent enzyme [Herbinix sp.]